MVLAANPGEVTNGFGGIEYMDELTSSICKNAKENETAQLTDWRDRKSYWVTKLKDGNCWMTQNLDYDGGGLNILSPAEWTTGDTSTVTNSTAAYYNPGNYYYTNSSSWTACSNNSVGLSSCTSSGWSTSGDGHYHVGNYYSYAAANGVCPSGWQLPTSNSTTNNGSFGKLTTAYGVTNSNTSVLRNSPLYFIPGGYVDSGALQVAGRYGWYWSSTASSVTYAYFLNFDSSHVNPSDNTARYVGMPVRCLVQGS